MNAFPVSIAVAALIPAALAFASARPGATVKCAVVNGPPARIVDGRVYPLEMDGGLMVLNGKRMTAEDIDSLSVRCSRETHRVFGVEPGRDLVIVWTKAVPPAALEASVRSLVPLQEAYWKEKGVFAAALADLPWSDPSGSIAVRLCVSEDRTRWSALGWRSSPLDDLPRVLVAGGSGSWEAVDPGGRFSCQVTPSRAEALAATVK